MTTSTSTSPSIATETGAAPAHHAGRRAFGLADPTTYRLSVHLLADLALGTASFSVMVTLLTTSAALAVTLVGLPLLVVTLMVARGVASLERLRARHGLGIDVIPPPRRPRTFLERLVDPADWRAACYAVLLFPVGVLNGTVVMAGWLSALAAIGHPVYARGLDDTALQLAGRTVDGVTAEVGCVLVGLALLVSMPFVVRQLARIDGVLVRRLLG
jgi:Putative sensor